jgi:hypothetical protein
VAQRAFWEVAQAGLERFDLGENPDLPYGEITDPRQAFETTLTMWALWVLIKENDTTGFLPLSAPECINEHTIALEASPLVPVRNILEEALVLTKRIREKGEVTVGETVVPLSIIDITLRVMIFRTEINVTAKADIDDLVAKHDAAKSDPIPVFGDDMPDIVGSSAVTIK